MIRRRAGLEPLTKNQKKSLEVGVGPLAPIGDFTAMHEPTNELTDLIRLASQNAGYAKDTLYAVVFDDLRETAHRLIRKQHRCDLQTTDLVNEVALRFESNNALKSMANRRVFFAVATRAMNQILLDQYRRRRKLVDSSTGRRNRLTTL